MPDLSASYFGDIKDIDKSVLKRLIVSNFGDAVEETLTKWGWEGQLVTTIGLGLSVDGSIIEAGEVLMRGGLTADPIVIPAAKIWDGVAKNVNLTISSLDSKRFSFKNGTLGSDFLWQDQVDFHLSKDGQPIMPPDYAAQNIGSFCLKLVIYLDKMSNTRKGLGPTIKFVVLCYPYAASELAELTDAAQSTNWPGIRILEGNSSLFPKLGATEIWGVPILPLICVKQRSSGSAKFPPGSSMKFAIAEIMRTAVLPNACATRAAWVKKCQELYSSETGPDPRTPLITWPTAQEPLIDQGTINVNWYSLLARSLPLDDTRHYV